MSSSTSVPIIAYGRDLDIGLAIAELIAPKYDSEYYLSEQSTCAFWFALPQTTTLTLPWLIQLVVHMCVDLDAALVEIPAVLKGDLSITPASGAGSNVKRHENERLAPKVVLCGGGIPDEEVQQLKEAASGYGEGLVWGKVNPEDIKAAGGPSPEIIAPLIKQLLKENGL